MQSNHHGTIYTCALQKTEDDLLHKFQFVLVNILKIQWSSLY